MCIKSVLLAKPTVDINWYNNGKLFTVKFSESSSLLVTQHFTV